MAQSVDIKKAQIQNITVVVRIRPLNDDELNTGVKKVVRCSSVKEIQAKGKKYLLDHVFDTDCSQMDVYSFVVAPMMNDVLSGYNCTVFVYGQTGSGKTYTMMGPDLTVVPQVQWKEDETVGCIPRAAAHLFEELGRSKIIDYNVKVSFLELYNEEIKDLLVEDGPPLNVYNDNAGGVCIQNLSEITVFNSNEICMLLQKGILKRHTAATKLNKDSSRSHSVFTITVLIREMDIAGAEILKTGKINLVDLAGSENIAKSGAKDKRVQESANINKSLLTLGRVIQQLAENNNKHVPYRDSKLTRILQDSLGGHTKTRIIATISPTQSALAESQNTLEYAIRSRDIKNTPLVNEKITQGDMIKGITTEINKLKKDLDAARTSDGFFVDRENWNEMQDKLARSERFLIEKTDVIEKLEKRLIELEAVRDIKEKQYENAMKVCNKQQREIDKAKRVLEKKRLALKEEQYLAEYYTNMAKENKNTAEVLAEHVNKLSSVQSILQRKLDNQYNIGNKNEKMIKSGMIKISQNATNLLNQLDQLQNINCDLSDRAENCVMAAKSNCTDYLQRSQEFWDVEKLPCIRSISERQKETVENIIDNHWRVVDNSKAVLQQLEDVNERGRITVSNDIAEIKSQLRANQEILTEESAIRKVQYHSLSKLVDLENKHLEELKYLLKVQTEKVDSLTAVLHEREKTNEDFSHNCTMWEKENPEAVLDVVLNRFDRIGDVLNKQKGEINAQKTPEEVYEPLLQQVIELEKIAEKIVTDHRASTNLKASDSIKQLEDLQKHIYAFGEEVGRKVANLKKPIESVKGTTHNFQLTAITRTGDTPRRLSSLWPTHVSVEIISRENLIEEFKNELCDSFDLENELLDSSGSSCG